MGIIIPTDFHIFQRGRYTTNQFSILICNDWIRWLAVASGVHSCVVGLNWGKSCFSVKIQRLGFPYSWGTPKASIFSHGFFPINHPFGGTPMTMETPNSLQIFGGSGWHSKTIHCWSSPPGCWALKKVPFDPRWQTS